MFKKNMYPDIAADLPSNESLSFAGLVCSQEHSSTTRSSEHLLQTTSLESRKHEPEFEFSRSVVIEPTNNSHHRAQVPAEKKVDLEDLLSPTKPYGKKSHDKTKLSNRTSSCNEKESSKGKKRTERQGFGQRLFSSFAGPCKDCRTDHVVKPTPHVVKEHALP